MVLNSEKEFFKPTITHWVFIGPSTITTRVRIQNKKFQIAHTREYIYFYDFFKNSKHFFLTPRKWNQIQVKTM